MAVVISVTNQKGGVGKSTISGNLAVELIAQGKSVALLDADPQHSTVDWASLGEGVLSRIVKPVDASNPKALRKALDEASARCDRVIVDTPPSLTDAALAAMAASDIVLLPVQPSPLDILAGKKALQLAREARKAKKGKLKIGLVPSKMTRTRMGADLMVALAAMSETLLPAIASRSAVCEAVLSGLSVREASPKSPAAEEFAAFAVAVEGMI